LSFRSALYAHHPPSLRRERADPACSPSSPSEQLSLTVKLPTGADVIFDLDPLAHEIDVAASKHRVLQPKVEITLKKKVGGVKWAKIEGEDDQAAVMGAWSVLSRREGETGGRNVPLTELTLFFLFFLKAGKSTTDNPTHAYPSSSRKQHNWDAIVKASAAEDEALAKDFSKDPNSGGDKQLNEMFQQLYAGATDDQRRAMIKSYQESNGTALSTDWKDVSKVRRFFLSCIIYMLTTVPLAEEGRYSPSRHNAR
jgi:suppressor of G2 allele of SKP1